MIEQIDLQPISDFVWSTKHRLSDKNGDFIDKNLEDFYTRVGTALASVEKDPKWQGEFVEALKNGAVPAGRILSNVGAGDYKPNTTLINCVVSTNIHDSLESIFDVLKEGAMTLKYGAGIGYCFSTIRPKGAFINGVGAATSGPISFAAIFDRMCSTIESAGQRRGSQMFTFHVCHPDVLDVIHAKTTKGKLTYFNISILIDTDFLEALKKDEYYPLYFPEHKYEETENHEVIYKPWPIKDDPNYTYAIREGEILTKCKIYKRVKAKEIWEAIMQTTYEHSEPGIINISLLNTQNNMWFCEDIIATNPCGEQGLPQNANCLLGSINLTRFVENPFKDDAKFNFELYEKTVATFNRMIDNAVELSNLPFEFQRKELFRKRRHGIGYFGLGSVFNMMKIRYGGEASVALTEEITKRLSIVSYKTGVELAKEKGAAPVMSEIFKHNGVEFFGRELVVKSGFMQKMPADLLEDIKTHGLRYSHATSIAPTGTISTGLGNCASGGIEPSFDFHYKRNIRLHRRLVKEQLDVYAYEYLLYRTLSGQDTIPDFFVAASDLSTEEHLNVQAAAQKWIDSSISKTINVPTDIDFEDFKEVYAKGLEMGIKSLTTYRFNPKKSQGVLVKTEDAKKSLFKFKLSDGREILVSGDQKIMYKGETCVASNLFDALSGSYGS